jgi:hypothetical protein
MLRVNRSSRSLTRLNSFLLVDAAGKPGGSEQFNKANWGHTGKSHS